jgi:GTPase involved in cell partitioning and DNA repair
VYARTGEVNQPGDKILVAKGGKGGDASNNYTGQRGHGYSIRLDLKLIADIGFVG